MLRGLVAAVRLLQLRRIAPVPAMLPPLVILAVPSMVCTKYTAWLYVPSPVADQPGT